MYKNEGAKGQVDTFIKTSNIKIRKKFDFILRYIADERNQFKEPYHCLKDYLARARCLSEYNMNYSDETIALVALLHDVCKINCYHKYLRNVKNEEGIWEQVAAFNFEDPEPFGHGEKSVFLISKFLRLTNEEAYAIRFHMGFSEEGSGRNAGRAFEKYPLALALNVADMEASYYVDDKVELELES